jgi:hypothetical protein
VTTVGDHGLSCLDDSSYAAIALSMQANAAATDAALAADRAAITAYGSSYVFKFTTTGTSTSGANSGNALPDGTSAASIMSRNLGLLPRGWYSASSSMTFQETGAVTAGSYRRAVIMVNAGTSVIPPTFFQSITSATNNGAADSTTVNAWFYSDGILTTIVRVFFGHGNTGSTITVAAGAVLTVRYMTTGLVT